ncbi:hypothetical protein [Uliginosibacterium sediminicola]|uniref:Transposase n=1 Tax=Uliginosibacterium sediminicola TaxID=2024550 RepID=A0ABU9YXY1_9RHOO
MSIITVGIDLAKDIFAVHGVGASGKAELVHENPGPNTGTVKAGVSRKEGRIKRLS